VAEHEIDLTKIQSAHDFEDLVTTLIFLKDLLSVNLIKNIGRNDLYWTTWLSDDKTDNVYRVIFDSPRRDPDKRDESLQSKFDEKVATVWRRGKPDTRVYLYLNIDDPPPDWAQNYEHLKIITATEIADLIKGDWWPIFHKYFEGGMRIKDAEECKFLKDFTESLDPEVEELSVKEAINVISWVESIAFYRPKDVLAFCQALYKSEKSTQEETHPVFGSITLGRDDYLKELPGLLQPVAAHSDYFEGALKLLLRISCDLDSEPHPIRGFLSPSVEKITGYYYGRDFLVKGNRAQYEPDFNQKTLDVIEGMLREEKSSALLVRCLAVLPNLLKIKVDTSEWSGDRRAVEWREYQLPLADEELRKVRKRALTLLLTTFNESKDKDLKHRCLIELHDTFHHLSLTEEPQDEFQVLFEFLRAHANDEDPFVMNWILEMLAPLSQTGPEEIRTEAKSLQKQLQDKFELQLYHLLFGKKGLDPSGDEVQKAVQQSLDKWSDDPRHLLVLIDGFHKTADSPPTGLVSFLRTLGYDETEFAASMISTISGDHAFRSGLSPPYIRSLGYILCGVKRKDKTQWQSCVNTLLAETDSDTATIALTGLHLHDYDDFEAEDLELVQRLNSGANENIRRLCAETLWYFHKYRDFTAVLKVYEVLSENMSQDQVLAASVLSGISHGSHQAGFAEKWATDNRTDILKNIIFALVNFPRLDWDSMAGYCLELMLRVLWEYRPDDLLEFFRLRLDPDRVKSEGYDPLPYDLSTLFQEVSDAKQNEFVSRVLEWDAEHYGIYWIARLIGLACSTNIQPSTLTTLRNTIGESDKNQLLLITKLLDQIPLGDTFYDLAMRIVEIGYDQREVRRQLYSSFISTTGGSRPLGEPFPAHVHHKKLIQRYRSLNEESNNVQRFLDQWEAEIDAMMQRDEDRDLER